MPWLLVPGSLAAPAILPASPLPFLLLGGCAEEAVPSGGLFSSGRTRWDSDPRTGLAIPGQLSAKGG